ncbi:PSME3-interacting protein-like [Pecten maximus]|uniref:PSME3-interacting protein-like n=1 Tax=Pecten maximus TaxID=6579 RepID=UPI001457F508|nr:PSME3-interacting protein-like [Pecten maximus]XP_033755274.1 PSME3-interacting protein-like [Pecten maximus]
MSRGGGSKDVPGMSMMSFVSQDEIDSTRKKRQEEWEKTRTEDQPLECPEEVVDNRSLFEKLQEQKMRQEEEYEETHKLKNSVKGLDEDEAGFLEYVSKNQIDILKARYKEEKDILKEIEDASVTKVTEGKMSDDRKISAKPQIGAAQNKKSQMSLLAGAVKRKGSDSVDDGKKRKLSPDDDPATDSPAPVLNGGCDTARIIGILPGLGAYNNDSSDSCSSSDDSEIDLRLTAQKKYVVVENE